jgi:ribosomal protein L6P/L9E
VSAADGRPSFRSQGKGIRYVGEVITIKEGKRK